MTDALLLDLREVSRRICLSRTTIYNLLGSDPDFPKPIHIRPRALRWRACEIREWVERKAEQRAA